MLQFKKAGVTILETDILDNLIIKKFYSASSVYTEKNAKAKRINRVCWAIVIKYEGETTYYTQERSYVSNINNMVILPKGCSYEWHCTKPGFFSIIEFDSDMIYDKIFSFPVKDGEAFLKLFKKLELKRTLKKPFCELESINSCYSIILKLLQTREIKYFPACKQQKIAAAMDYIAKNYNKSTIKIKVKFCQFYVFFNHFMIFAQNFIYRKGISWINFGLTGIILINRKTKVKFPMYSIVSTLIIPRKGICTSTGKSISLRTEQEFTMWTAASMHAAKATFT